MSEPESLSTELTTLFCALANRDRLHLLNVLLAQHADPGGADVLGTPINVLAREAELSRFAASRHLAILRESGLVAVDRVGLTALHRLTPARFELLEDWLFPYLDLVAPVTTGTVPAH